MISMYLAVEQDDDGTYTIVYTADRNTKLAELNTVLHTMAERVLEKPSRRGTTTFKMKVSNDKQPIE